VKVKRIVANVAVVRNGSQLEETVTCNGRNAAEPADATDPAVVTTLLERRALAHTFLERRDQVG
jgi:hypothetical protein